MQSVSQCGDVEQESEEKSEGNKMQEKKNASKSTRGSKRVSHVFSSTVRHLVD